MVRFHNLYLDLAEAGVDWLAETVQGLPPPKIAPWVSVRMNDTHGVEDAASHFNCKVFRDPANRLSGRATDPSDPPHPHWVALNYARQPGSRFHVRPDPRVPRGLRIRGDRSSTGCAIRTSWSRALREADCRMITAWLRDVRAYTEARGRVDGQAHPARPAHPRQPRVPAQPGPRCAGHRARGPGRFHRLLELLADLLGYRLPAASRRDSGPDVVFYGVVEDAPNWVPGTPARQAKTCGAVSEPRRPLHGRQRAHAAGQRGG